MAMTKSIFFFFFLLLLLLLLEITAAAAAAAPALPKPVGVHGDTMIPGATLEDGDILVSARGMFALGFFRPGTSRNRYLGVWYFGLPVRTVVWVANRAAPLNTSSGALELTFDGKIVLVDGGSILWSSGAANATNPALQLLDSGNLVLTEDDRKDVLWQSFDHPCDTFLPGMKIGVDFRNNVTRHLTSWKSVDDPSPGEYHYKIETRPVPKLFTWKGSTKVSSSRPWREQGPYTNPYIGAGSIFRSEFVSNQLEIYHSIKSINASVPARMVLDATGMLHGAIWSNESNGWIVLGQIPTDPCDNFTRCGVNSICSPDFSPVCQCMRGFAAKSPKNWENEDYSDGCVRQSCLSEEFLILRDARLPDTQNAAIYKNKTQDACRAWCLINCFCSGYAVNSGIGCLIWSGDLKDTGYLKGGDEFYIRLAASESLDAGQANGTGTNSSKKSSLPVIIVVSVIGTIVLVAALLLYLRKRRRYHGVNPPNRPRGASNVSDHGEGQEKELSELPLFAFSSISAATDHFSDANKLGEGGFGLVYKGRLPGEEMVAVKRLSRTSGQGSEEFKNEVILIAKLQHRNLVRLLGCCIHGEEKILIYEYMPNKSLDAILFDAERKATLDWNCRFNIIEGIARGLLYLHRDSRLRVVHRDLKAGNILLDSGMNPKISDFGMAKIFGGDKNQDNTGRVVGTFGYMSPEYAMEGVFSDKSDVYSFGILLLEIIIGLKNSSFHQTNYLNIVGYVWQLWNEDRTQELIDPSMRPSCPTRQALRCIQVGLLCVQDRAVDRPDMQSVILMMGSEAGVLPMPRQPIYLSEESSAHSQFSANDLTVTSLRGR